MTMPGSSSWTTWVGRYGQSPTPFPLSARTPFPLLKREGRYDYTLGLMLGVRVLLIGLVVIAPAAGFAAGRRVPASELRLAAAPAKPQTSSLGEAVPVRENVAAPEPRKSRKEPSARRSTWNDRKYRLPFYTLVGVGVVAGGVVGYDSSSREAKVQGVLGGAILGAGAGAVVGGLYWLGRGLTTGDITFADIGAVFTGGAKRLSGAAPKGMEKGPAVGPQGR